MTEDTFIQTMQSNIDEFMKSGMVEPLTEDEINEYDRVIKESKNGQADSRV